MKNAMKLGSFEALLLPTEDAFTRLGTLGVVGGGLLALASMMF